MWKVHFRAGTIKHAQAHLPKKLEEEGGQRVPWRWQTKGSSGKQTNKELPNSWAHASAASEESSIKQNVIN